MTSERWQHIDRLFHATLECAPEERAGFLSKACRGDDDLRNEVESLLRAHEQDATFLDIPAYELAADFLTDALGGLLPGQQIGPYKILAPLATGGMGEVYLAQDSRLGRKVALKLLPPDFARDQHRVRRFAQEARAASALSHPNVCVIHEVGKTSDGRHFIAMEYIDGITLRERIAHGPLSLNLTLAMAEQIAAALSAAHIAGVIHRDIKPENIMLRKDGYVKVLDFGLAKLNESQPNPPDLNEAPTMAHFHTEPGTQMGTVRYMSPEHLRERPVDERADIWSFGVVLYEMVTGSTPFEARSRAEIIALILKRQPPELSFSENVPREFQQIVAKALSKDRGQRYASVDDLATDLKKLRRQIEGETTSEPLAEPIAVGKHGVTKSSLESATRHQRKLAPASSTDRLSSALTYVSHTAEQILTGIRAHPKATIFSGITAVVALLVIGPGISHRLSSFFSRTPQQQVVPFQAIKMMPLTNAGQSVCAAISPDGKFVAHAEQKDGLQQLVLTNTATAASQVIIPPSAVTYVGVTFSHDNNYLYFTRRESSDTGAIYQVALPGRPPRRIEDDADTSMSFSPTGDRFAFIRVNKVSREHSLMIASADGSEERPLATWRDASNIFVGPTWSPDGRSIVCVSAWWEKDARAKLVRFDVESGHSEQIRGRQWYSIYQVAWLGDGHLIVCAKEEALSPIQLWRVSYPAGATQRITNDTANYESVSVSRDENTLVTVQTRQQEKLWVTPGGDSKGARAVASMVGRVYGLDWTSGGKIVFSSMIGNDLNLSTIDADGSNQTQLTANAHDNYMPATTPDGRSVVFASNRSGSLNIWRINAADGSDPKQLTFTEGNAYPTCSPDGKWVVYDNQANPTVSVFTVWRVPIDGGQSIQLTDKYARMPVVSPDGQFMTCRNMPDDRTRGIAIFPSSGGAPIEQLPIPVMDWQRLQWTPDGGALTYIASDKGVFNIWSYDRDARSSKQLTNFTTNERIFAYAWSPDFKQVACLRGNETRDVTVIINQE
jgi:serine/threonine protein kinase/Tol biopolymer transport system component